MLPHQNEVEHINDVVVVEVTVLPLHELTVSEQELLHQHEVVHVEIAASVNVSEDFLRRLILLRSVE